MKLVVTNAVDPNIPKHILKNATDTMQKHVAGGNCEISGKLKDMKRKLENELHNSQFLSRTQWEQKMETLGLSHDPILTKMEG